MQPTLNLCIPAVVTARALSVALDRALPTRTCARRDFAQAIGVPQPDVSRAADYRRGDTVSLVRVAAAAGYEPHPTRPGSYRCRVATMAIADPVEA